MGTSVSGSEKPLLIRFRFRFRSMCWFRFRFRFRFRWHPEGTESGPPPQGCNSGGTLRAQKVVPHPRGAIPVDFRSQKFFPKTKQNKTRLHGVSETNNLRITEPPRFVLFCFVGSRGAPGPGAPGPGSGSCAPQVQVQVQVQVRPKRFEPVHGCHEKVQTGSSRFRFRCTDGVKGSGAPAHRQRPSTAMA